MIYSIYILLYKGELMDGEDGGSTADNPYPIRINISVSQRHNRIGYVFLFYNF